MTVSPNPPRVTVGIDLAAQPERTAVCRVDWSQHPPVVELLDDRWTDDALRALIGDGAKVGIDCPLGWPREFVDAVAAHGAGRPWPSGDGPDNRRLTHRLTDREVARETGRWPLSVSTDRIGVVALRCARILDGLGAPVDRAGLGAVVEVYPAAALRKWGLKAEGSYKRSTTALDRLVTDFRALVPLGFVGNAEEQCRARHDDFDALVCAVIAFLAASGRTIRPQGDQLPLASEEGWIHLPSGELADVSRGDALPGRS